MTVTVAHLYRYPVKGLSAESLERITLARGGAVPGDRQYALALPSVSCGGESPRWLAKSCFLTLMRNPRLAALETRFEEATATLVIGRNGKPLIAGCVATPEGRDTIETFLYTFLDGELPGPPRLVSAAAGGIFSDHPDPLLSVIGLPTIAEIERVAGVPIDPLRFRANVYLAGTVPWQEFGWIGQMITVGQVRLHCLDRVDRCAATTVQPGSGVRDINIPKLLEHCFGHTDCGVFTAVATTGEISIGAQVASPPLADQ